MILAKLPLTESHQMTFDLMVEGTSERASSVRLIIEGKDYDISCKCDIGNGTINANIPKLKGILESGAHDVRLEVIVDNKLFVPLKETIEFERLIETNVGSANIKTLKEDVKTTPKLTISTKCDTPEDALRKVLKEGYDVENIKDMLIVTKEDKFYGIVDETTVKMTVGFADLDEMLGKLK